MQVNYTQLPLHPPSATHFHIKKFDKKERDQHEVVYKRRAARPAAAIKPVAPVGREPIAEDVADDAALPAAEVAEETLLVADEASLEALEATLDAAEEAEDPTDDATDEALSEAPEATEDALAETPEAAEDALAATPPAPKMVVDPTVVSKVDDPLVTVDTMAEVVIADSEADSVAEGVL